MPRARKTAARPGLKALMGRVTARGMQAVDRRSVAYRAMKEWRDKVLVALGGEEQVSPQRLTVLEMACRTKLYVDHADSFLFSQRMLINRRRKSYIALVEQRQRLADSLVKQLQTLGLDRVPKNVLSLPELLRQREAEKNAEQAG